MDTKETAKLWKTVLGEIQTEVSAANFMTLFKKASLESISGNKATITTPYPMIVKMLEERFSEVIKKSLDKHTKMDIVLVFESKGVSVKEDEEEKNGPLFSQEEVVVTHVPKSLNFLPRVRTDFTFESLAVSGSNQLAFVSAQNVSKNPGKSYNPLFIYGPVGVGKTHLMQAVANEVYKNNPQSKIIYTTSEEFTNEVVEAIRFNDTSRMKKRFRSADLLIIDDVQFIAGKDKIQEELFHTFNILIDKSAQIVLSSDKPPEEIKKLEKRLSSRFASGLTVDIETPDFELRSAILLIKAKKRGVDLPIEAAKYIAENVLDVRGMEGVLLRIITEAQSKNEEITPELTMEILSGRKKEQKEILHADDVINKICQFYNIKLTQIKGPKRDARLVRARQISMFILKKKLRLTLVEIGNILGGRDHTTIMHGVEKIEFILSTKEEKQSSLNSEILGINKILFE